MLYIPDECQKNCLFASKVYKEHFPNKLEEDPEITFRRGKKRFDLRDSSCRSRNKSKVRQELVKIQ